MKTAIITPKENGWLTKKRSAKTGFHPKFIVRLFILITLALFSPIVHAVTINVPADQPTIQAAIDSALAGDVVRVAPGTYLESDITFNDRDIVLQSESGAAVTIIDGEQNDRVFHLAGALTRNTIIEGFTIKNGLNFKPGGGGGMRIIDGSPTIRNNIFESNSTPTGGGGIRVTFDANPLIINNTFQDNTAPSGRGGGLEIELATAVVTGNSFLRNKAFGIGSSSGGAIRVLNATSNVLISGNEMMSNTSTFAGGAINAIGSDIEIVDNLIAENESKQGAGIHLETPHGAYTWTVKNNVIRDNIAEFGAGGLNVFPDQGDVSLLVEGNQIISNQATVSSCTTGAQAECGQGGGIRASQGTGNEVYINNLIKDNVADNYAGALLLGIAHKTVVFEANRVESNNSKFIYPGVSCVGVADCTIARNEFLSNESIPMPPSGVVPGGLFLKNTRNAVVENNFFHGNKGREAGAFYAAESDLGSMDVLIRNNTFVDNVTEVSARATIYLRGEQLSDISVTLINNIIQGDIRGIYVRNSPTLDIRNNDFIDFSNGIYRSGTNTFDTVATLNAASFASSNITVDPGLADATDVHLSHDSLLRGVINCNETPTADFDNELRPPSGCDIGADQYSVDSLIFHHGFEIENPDDQI